MAATAPFIINNAVPPASLDPSQACSLEDIGFISNLYATLLKYRTKAGPSGTRQEDPTKFVGYLAKSWSVTNGGKTITFKLRNQRFPSGRPVDSHAVKFTLERNLTVGSCGAFFANAGQVTPLIKAIETPNATTVVLRLARPEPLMLHTLTEANNGILDPGLIRSHGGVEKGKANVWLASHSAGSGPYLLQSYAPGRRAVLVANPRFFGPAPRERAVIVNFVTSDSTLLLQARNGQADVTIGLTKKSVASLKGNPCCKIISVPAAASQLIALPNQMAPFNNVKLRQALSYAVPYSQILERVAYGYGQLFYGPYPPALPQFKRAIAKPRAYNLARAKELLAESKVSTPINLDMVIREGVNDQEQIATIVQDVWRQVGVNVRIQKLSSASYANAVSATKKSYALIRFDGPSVPDPAWLFDYDLRCASIFNTSNYCNKGAEALLEKAHPVADPRKRQVFWDRIVRTWVADSPRIPVYAENYTIVLAKDVKNYHFGADDYTFHLWGR